MYLGSIISVGANQLTPIFIGYLSPTKADVGFFSLSMLLCSPLSIIPNVIARTNFKRYSQRSTIPRKDILYTILISCLGLLAIWIIIPVFIKYFYDEDFTPVIKLGYIISFGYFLWGIGDFFMLFFSSQGKSKAIRNSYFFTGTFSILLNLLLIPWLGAIGSAFTFLINAFLYLLIMIYYSTKNKALSFRQ